MPVVLRDIVPGEYFMTAGGELRKVYRVQAQPDGTRHVWYQCKPVALPAQPLLFGHAQANPPLLADFAAQCAYHVGATELQTLRERGVLLQYE